MKHLKLSVFNSFSWKTRRKRNVINNYYKLKLLWIVHFYILYKTKEKKSAISPAMKKKWFKTTLTRTWKFLTSYDCLNLFLIWNQSFTPVICLRDLWSLINDCLQTMWTSCYSNHTCLKLNVSILKKKITATHICTNPCKCLF